MPMWMQWPPPKLSKCLFPPVDCFWSNPTRRVRQYILKLKYINLSPQDRSGTLVPSKSLHTWCHAGESCLASASLVIAHCVTRFDGGRGPEDSFTSSPFPSPDLGSSSVGTSALDFAFALGLLLAARLGFFFSWRMGGEATIPGGLLGETSEQPGGMSSGKSLRRSGVCIAGLFKDVDGFSFSLSISQSFSLPLAPRGSGTCSGSETLVVLLAFLPLPLPRPPPRAPPFPVVCFASFCLAAKPSCSRRVSTWRLGQVGLSISLCKNKKTCHFLYIG